MMISKHRNRARAELAFKANCMLAESPVWLGNGELVWIDIVDRKLCRARLGGAAAVTKVDLPMTVSAIVEHVDGGFVAAAQDGFHRMETEGVERPTFSPVGTNALLPEGWRLNDGACDRQGRFWSGEMFLHAVDPRPSGRLFRLSSPDRIDVGEGTYMVQNGLAWSPDGRTMYVSDSHPDKCHVLRFTYDPSTGTMADGVLHADAAVFPGRPDGAAMDVDGCYWVAASDAGLVVRLTPDGKLDAQIELPVPNPTNLCFAGPDLKTMVITTMSRADVPAQIYAIDTSYQGVPEARFAAAGGDYA